MPHAAVNIAGGVHAEDSSPPRQFLPVRFGGLATFSHESGRWIALLSRPAASCVATCCEATVKLPTSQFGSCTASYACRNLRELAPRAALRATLRATPRDLSQRVRKPIKLAGPVKSCQSILIPTSCSFLVQSAVFAASRAVGAIPASEASFPNLTISAERHESGFVRKSQFPAQFDFFRAQLDVVVCHRVVPSTVR